jgi:hypothetical protein
MCERRIGNVSELIEVIPELIHYSGIPTTASIHQANLFSKVILK